MAEVKVGDKYVSRLGTNLRLTVLAVRKADITIKAERRTVDRKTGEIVIEERERVVLKENWRHATAGYVRTRKT